MKVIPAAILLIGAALASSADASDWTLVGSWRLDVSCKGFAQVNTLVVSEASLTRVLGTTNVNDGYGKIVAGKFDGQNFVLTNKYKWNGRSYTEEWKGSLSRGGKYLRGRFSTDNEQAGGCSFKGPRV
jgi:hypothetical protein